MTSGFEERLYRRLVGQEGRDDDGDVPREVLDRQPRNFLLHVQALSFTKAADGLIDPKLVLAWLLGHFGAPAAALGLLVPVREAGALLPQLTLAPRVDGAARKRTAWAVGAFGQAAAVAGIAFAAWRGDGPAAGWWILAFLAVFSIFRALSSVSYKPLQGATLRRGTRGSATGIAGSIGAAAVLGFGALLASDALPLSPRSLAAIIGMAAVLWLLAGTSVLFLRESPRDGEGAPRTPSLSLRESFGLLREPAFLRFCVVRALLVPTALAPPFLVAAGGKEQSMGTLGVLVLASSGAAVFSSAFWGRFADRSSRRVLMWSGWLAAIPLGSMSIAAHFESPWLASKAVLPSAMFALMCAYHGVRVGRATHLVDMAPQERRAAYTAVSNTLIGGTLVLASGLGFLSQWGGPGAPLMLSAVLCLVAGVLARSLDEVQ